nr:unnamed protein product [Digitaria exilis]
MTHQRNQLDSDSTLSGEQRNGGQVVFLPETKGPSQTLSPPAEGAEADRDPIWGEGARRLESPPPPASSSRAVRCPAAHEAAGRSLPPLNQWALHSPPVPLSIVCVVDWCGVEPASVGLPPPGLE